MYAVRDDIADLVTRRAMPTASINHIDPFLFLNHHGPQNWSRLAPRESCRQPCTPNLSRQCANLNVFVEFVLA
jgi:hypothetical protein